MTVIFYYEENEEDVQIESCELDFLVMGQTVYFTFETLREPNCEEIYNDDSVKHWEKHNHTEWEVINIHSDIKRFYTGTKAITWAKVKKIK